MQMLKRESKKTAEEIPYRNIKHLRERGYTFEEIGERVGLTKQRVHRIINDFYPGTKPVVLSEVQAAKTLGTTKLRLFFMRKRGEIHPLKRGVMHRYNEKTLEEVRKALKKNCEICGALVPSGPPGNRKYCQVCSEKMSDPKQARDLPGMREKHNEYIRRYRETHKEQVRIGRRKSDAKYRAKVKKRRENKEPGSV